MRRVCWQKLQPYPALRTVQPWLKYLSVVTARVVQKDMNGRHCRGVALQLFQHLLGRMGVDLLTLNKGELEGLKVERASYVEPLAP